ncbi:MAG: iojap-like protein [Clostridiales bacterium]|nr:iojap-like protein [Clostridiales bacterium]
MELKAKLNKIKENLEEKKARDIEVVHIGGMTVLTDYFVICSGTSTTHIKALADELEVKMAECGVELSHKEGYETARWILLDFDDIIVHIFHDEDRKFYNLERLWADGAKMHKQHQIDF